MKWKNVELKGNDTMEFRNWLKTNSVRYEASDAGSGYTHFEILCDDVITEKANHFLETL
jgi:hypothetical protein